jgi:S1-C subfamily serine protease
VSDIIDETDGERPESQQPAWPVTEDPSAPEPGAPAVPEMNSIAGDAAAAGGADGTTAEYGAFSLPAAVEPVGAAAHSETFTTDTPAAPSTSPTERPTLDPYRMEAPAAAPAESLVERYRQLRDEGPAVRPLDPFVSAGPGSSRRVEPVAPAPRTYYYPAPETRQQPPQPRRWPMALLALSSGLIGALLVVGGLFVGGIFEEEEPPPTTQAPATAPAETIVVREVITPDGAEAVATAVGLKVVPSIVTVEVGTGNATSSFQGFGSGSGVVYSADGLILTNHHVVDGATTSRVIFQDGRIYEATIIGSDELTDLAVLQIEATGLTPIEIGSSDGLRIGDRAIAVGNPLGLQGGASLTVGVVSAFDREVDTGDLTPLFGMIQTDAPITNGSSGGALVDAEGKLIGITTAIGVSQSGAEGIGFATPVELVRRIASQIIETGDVTHAFLGVQLQPNFAIQEDGSALPTGAVVAGFGEGDSAARDAGLQVDDVILSWDGNEVRTVNDLISGIRRSSVGEAVTLVVDRGGEQIEFEVILGERPEGV